MSEKEFLQIYSGYHGEEIDNIKQLVRHNCTGEELFEFVAHAVSQSKWQTTAKELAQRLNEAKLQLEYLSEKFGKTATGNVVISRINYALSNYKTLSDGEAK